LVHARGAQFATLEKMIEDKQWRSLGTSSRLRTGSTLADHGLRGTARQRSSAVASVSDAVNRASTLIHHSPVKLRPVREVTVWRYR
jgi:hypothetical protein